MSLSFSTRNYSEFCAILFRCYQSGNFSRTAESVVTWTRIIINFIGLFIELSCNTHTQTHRYTICEMCSSRFLGLTEKKHKNTKKKQMITHLCGQTEVRQRCVLITYNNNTPEQSRRCVYVSVCVCVVNRRALCQ